MMQIIHLGFHKTGTTGLQKMVFQHSGVPYNGIGLPASRSDRLLFICGETVQDLEPLRSRDCILSTEGGLLLLGGTAELPRVAAAIASGFSDPVLLVTIRRQADLLRSAFCQSLKVRRHAIGFRNGGPICQNPPTTFSQWWRAMIDAEERSLAGLLRYRRLVAKLSGPLPRERIALLPLEWICASPDLYVGTLQRIGIPETPIRQLLASPPVNSGKNRKLRHKWSHTDFELVRGEIDDYYWQEQLETVF